MRSTHTQQRVVVSSFYMCTNTQVVAVLSATHDDVSSVIWRTWYLFISLFFPPFFWISSSRPWTCDSTWELCVPVWRAVGYHVTTEFNKKFKGPLFSLRPVSHLITLFFSAQPLTCWSAAQEDDTAKEKYHSGLDWVRGQEWTVWVRKRGQYNLCNFGMW